MVMLGKFGETVMNSIAFYGKTAINLMCQQSTFKQFTSNQRHRNLLLTEYNALLLDGDAF